MRECLDAAQALFAKSLTENVNAKEYLEKRSISQEQIMQFGIGFAPDSFSTTYEHLLKQGFSRKEIVDASLGIQKDLSEGRIYDRFRNRVTFPIADGNGQVIGFGGRTLGADDAKYINSGETALYNKSTVLYGLHFAKEAIRKTKTIILVEGYFDVLACHKLGVANVVAASGTALTEQHVALLKRYADKVVLCLDQDAAGKKAAERAFLLCSAAGIPVNAITLEGKDPDEAANSHPEEFKEKLEQSGRPYLDILIDEFAEGDTDSSEAKRGVLTSMIPLLDALLSSVERGHYIGKVAALLGTTEVALKEDIETLRVATPVPVATVDTLEPTEQQEQKTEGFNSTEITLGLFVLFPTLRSHLSALIEPEDLFCSALYTALKDAPDTDLLTLEMLALPEEFTERASILLLFCEHHGFSDWSASLAEREIQKNCRAANAQLLQAKQRDIAKKLMQAHKEGNTAEAVKLQMRHAEILKLAKMAAK